MYEEGKANDKCCVCGGGSDNEEVKPVVLDGDCTDLPGE